MSYDPRELLARSAELIGDRGAQYGQIENNFQLIADLATLRLGRTVHPYEIATMHACTKAARLFANPTHIDSRLDLANYEMFAALFADDYARSAPNDIDWKKREELKKAEAVMPPRDKRKTPRTGGELNELLDDLSGQLRGAVEKAGG